MTAVDDTLDYWKARAKRLEGRLLLREKMHRQNDVTAERLGEARRRIKDLEAEVEKLREDARCYWGPGCLCHEPRLASHVHTDGCREDSDGA